MSKPDILSLKELFLEQLYLSHRAYPVGDFRSDRLLEAMEYALLLPGKRLRPLLALASALSMGREKSDRAIKLALPSAIAIEFIHTYSLIHDDLPAMDDDDMRRGKATLHRRYDEALAILAGDALLTDAFFWAASSANNAHLICQQIALACGSRGLIAGQSEDLNHQIAVKARAWWQINQAKTANLYMASALVGALAVDAEKPVLAQAKSFGQAFGIAFQIKDDLDDEAGLVNSMDKSMLAEELNRYLLKAKTLAESLPKPDLLHELLYLTFAI